MIDQLRAAPGGQRAVRFESASRVHVEVGDRTCVTPCTLEGLPSGDIPWRATGTGIATPAAFTEVVTRSASSPNRSQNERAALAGSSRCGPRRKEADVLLSDLRKPFAAPQFLWLRAGADRIALRGRGPQGHAFYRGVTPMSEAPDDDDLLGVIKASLASDASVGAPVQSIGLFARWASGGRRTGQGYPSSSLPKPSLPKVSPHDGALGDPRRDSGDHWGGHVPLSATAKAVGYDPILGFKNTKQLANGACFDSALLRQVPKLRS